MQIVSLRCTNHHWVEHHAGEHFAQDLWAVLHQPISTNSCGTRRFWNAPSSPETGRGTGRFRIEIVVDIDMGSTSFPVSGRRHFAP